MRENKTEMERSVFYRSSPRSKFMSSPRYSWEHCHSEVLEAGLKAPDGKPSGAGRG